MYILGIDPGTGRTGWGVIKVEEGNKITYVAHGCIVTTLEDLMHDRLKILHEKLHEIIERYKPDSMIVEHIFFGMNSRTAISVSQARGVILLTCSMHKLALHEYTGIAVKKLISGSGKAEKKEMQRVVRVLLNLTDETLAFSAKDKAFDDSADALAIAIHHAWKSVNYEPEERIEQRRLEEEAKLTVKKEKVQARKDRTDAKKALKKKKS